jgi:hypothetical protein
MNENTYEYCLDAAFHRLPSDEALAWCNNWLQDNANAPLHQQHTVRSLKMSKEMMIEKDEVIRQSREVIRQSREVIRQKDEIITANQEVIMQKDEIITANQEQSREVIRQKDEIITANQEVIMQKDEIIMQKDEINTANQEQSRAKSLGSLREMVPVLRDCTNSEPHFPSLHKPAALVPFKTIPSTEDFNAWLESSNVAATFWDAELWVTRPKNSRINCDSESFTVYYVLGILNAVLLGLGLANVVEPVVNRTLAGVECDILLVYQVNRLPFATIEVKKPTSTFENLKLVFVGKKVKNKIENRVAGQILDQCNVIKLFGFSNVFGLITTGNMWRMVCTPTATNNKTIQSDGEEGKDSSELVLPWENKDLPGLQNIVDRLSGCSQVSSPGEQNEDHRNATNVACTTTTVSPERQTIDFKTSAAVSMPDRTLYATPILPPFPNNYAEYQSLEEKPRSGEDMVALVAWFVLRACSTLVEFLSKEPPTNSIEKGSRIPCRILSINSETFAFGTIALDKLNLDAYLKHPSKQEIYVIRYLGRGEHGSCCLAVSSTGASSCVVKFFHRETHLALGDATMAAQNELENWERVYPVNFKAGWKGCAVRQVAGGRCLIMPYVHPIPVAERRVLLQNCEIDNALNEFSKSGFIHKEPRWRHIGKWKGALIFIDLGFIEEASKEDIDDWKKKTMAHLDATAGDPAPPDSTTGFAQGQNHPLKSSASSTAVRKRKRS